MSTSVPSSICPGEIPNSLPPVIHLHQTDSCNTKFMGSKHAKRNVHTNISATSSSSILYMYILGFQNTDYKECHFIEKSVVQSDATVCIWRLICQLSNSSSLMETSFPLSQIKSISFLISHNTSGMLDADAIQVTR